MKDERVYSIDVNKLTGGKCKKCKLSGLAFYYASGEDRIVSPYCDKCKYMDHSKVSAAKRRIRIIKKLCDI